MKPEDLIWQPLTAEEEGYGNSLGLLRQTNAIDEGRVPHNAAPTEKTKALRMHQLGGRCELAVARWLKPVRWNAFVRGSLAKLAEFEDFLDAKGREKEDHCLLLQRDDPPEWAYLMVHDQFRPNYCIGGWGWGWELKDHEKFWRERVPGRPCFWIPPDHGILRPPKTLVDVLRQRQRRKTK